MEKVKVLRLDLTFGCRNHEVKRQKKCSKGFVCINPNDVPTVCAYLLATDTTKQLLQREE